jgi:hypothetical protein
MNQSKNLIEDQGNIAMHFVFFFFQIANISKYGNLGSIVKDS